MARAVIGLGSNLGSREAFLRGAAQLLSSAVPVLARSALYETEPVGPPQPAFLNAALAVELRGSPEELLARLLAIEETLGRVRVERWGPRTIDLDLLHVEGVTQRSERLELPHPRLAERAFALVPLLDVAPWLRPTYGPIRDALEPLSSRAWTEADGPEPRERAEALALALTRWLGEGPARDAVPLAVPDEATLATEATSLPGACGVVIERWDAAGIAARALLDGARHVQPGLLDTRCGRVVVIPRAPKVG